MEGPLPSTQELESRVAVLSSDLLLVVGEMLHLDRVMAVTRAAYAATLVVDGSRVAVALGVAALATYAAKCVVLKRAVDVASPRLREAAAWLHVSFHLLSVATEVVVLTGL